MILLSIMGFALAVLGCYLIGGGWVDNGFELYRNYRRYTCHSLVLFSYWCLEVTDKPRLANSHYSMGIGFFHTKLR